MKKFSFGNIFKPKTIHYDSKQPMPKVRPAPKKRAAKRTVRYYGPTSNGIGVGP